LSQRRDVDWKESVPINRRDDQMNCQYCGAPIPDDARFCPQCGVRIASSAAGWAEEKAVNIQPKPVIDFGPYIAERTRDFTGREWVFEAIDKWLRDPDGARVFLLTGQPGCGKTAIAARLVQFSRGEVTPPEGMLHLVSGFLSAVHFCSARDRRWINPHTFTESLAVQLSACYPSYAAALAEKSSEGRIRIDMRQRKQSMEGSDQQIGVIIQHLDVRGVTAEDAFISVVREPLEALARAQPDQQVAILVDALDEAFSYSGQVGIVSLLTQAEHLPATVRFVISTRPRTEVLRPLQRIAPKPYWLTQDAGLVHSMRDVRTHILHMLNQQPELVGKLAADLSQEAFAEVVRDKSQGNFLYVRNLLQTLAAQPATITSDPLDELPTGVEAIYVEFLERLLEGDWDVWAERYAPLLGTLAVARHALSEQQLAGFVGITRHQVRRHLRTLRSFLNVDESLSPSQRTYAIYHRSFVDFLLDEDRSEEYWCEEQAQHERIARYYLFRFKDNWQECDVYGLLHLAAHLAKCGRDDILRRLLFDLDWMQAKLDAASAHALAIDYDLLPDDKELRLVQGAVQLSAHILNRDTSLLWSQLYGRLITRREPNIRAMLSKLPKMPWLRPLTASLIPPGGPLLRTLQGHTDVVSAVAVTPDVRYVISASRDGELRVWEVVSGMLIRMLHRHTDAVNAVAVTPDSKVAISASSDGTARVWNIDSGRESYALLGHSAAVNAVAATPDGKFVISASDDCTLRVWDLENGKEKCVLKGHADAITFVAATPDGRQVISASADRTLRAWDLENGKEKCMLKGHADAITFVAATPDGRQVVSASADRTLRAWDLESGKELRVLQGHTDVVTCVAITPDGQRVVSSSTDHTLRVWDLESGEGLRTLQGHTDAVTAVAITPDARRAVSASIDHTVRVWNLEDGKALRSLTGHTASVRAVVAMPDGRRAITASDDATLKVWNLESTEELSVAEGHADAVRTVAIAPNGGQIITASSDRTLKVWDARGHRIATFSADGELRVCAVAGDGSAIIAGDVQGRVHILRLDGMEDV
jgi:WD40 repeat protein